MTFTEQQLADLYERAVAAEAAGEHSTDAGYELDNIALELAPNYGGLIRVLIDQLRNTSRAIPDGWEPCSPEWIERSGPCSCAEAPRIAFGHIGNHYHPMMYQKPVSHILPEIERLPTCTMVDVTGMVHGVRLDSLRKLLGAEPVAPQPDPDTGLDWLDMVAISDRPAVHSAFQQFSEDATEDNAVFLIRAVAEALRPRPRFWVDVHGFQSYLKFSESDAIASCNETGGLYVLPLFAGEPINTKLPMRMCRLADEPETIAVAPLLRSLNELPQKYTNPHVSMDDLMTIINNLRTGNEN